jgi:hypothetical protein
MNAAGITLEQAIQEVQELRKKFVALGIKLNSQYDIPTPGDVDEYYQLKQESTALKTRLAGIRGREERVRSVFEFLEFEIQDVGRYMPSAPMPVSQSLMMAPAAGGAKRKRNKRRASRKAKATKKFKKSKKTRRTKD